MIELVDNENRKYVLSDEEQAKVVSADKRRTIYVDVPVGVNRRRSTCVAVTPRVNCLFYSIYNNEYNFNARNYNEPSLVRCHYRQPGDDLLVTQQEVYDILTTKEEWKGIRTVGLVMSGFKGFYPIGTWVALDIFFDPQKEKEKHYGRLIVTLNTEIIGKLQVEETLISSSTKKRLKLDAKVSKDED